MATLNGMRAIIEVCSPETGTGNVIEVAFLTLFNERETPLRVVVGDTESAIELNGGLTEILGSYHMAGKER